MRHRTLESTLFPYTTLFRSPVVVLLHGYAENSDSWAPLAADLMKDHSVVVPDLRGIGRSSKVRNDHTEGRSEEHTSELQSRRDLVCRLLLEKKKIVYMRSKL